MQRTSACVELMPKLQAHDGASTIHSVSALISALGKYDHQVNSQYAQSGENRAERALGSEGAIFGDRLVFHAIAFLHLHAQRPTASAHTTRSTSGYCVLGGRTIAGRMMQNAITTAMTCSPPAY
jgi:hypothetical protein